MSVAAVLVQAADRAPPGEAGLSPVLIPILSVVGGVALGALLTALSTWLNNRAAREQAREQAERDAEARREEWERADRIRAEEQEQAEKHRNDLERLRAYKAFVAATTFSIPLVYEAKSEQLLALNESYTEVCFLAPSTPRAYAEPLYEAAVDAIYFVGDPAEEPAKDARAALREERENFWRVARADGDD